GILFRLIDTAGIREGAEEIEAMGIERSREKFRQAKIVLCMGEATHLENLAKVKEWASTIRMAHPDKKVFLVANKADLGEYTKDSDVLYISAKHGTGIDNLKAQLVEGVVGDFNMADETIVTNVRHYDALQRTIFSLEKAQRDLQENVTADFIAMDIRQAMYDLGSITGDISTDDLLGNIFSKFCIGK
ncbi:MAG: tRNA uridine-5-carboxymethylaminomethyl(34) synthesis GTPase MnmE, partial [Flavobacteriia bacterium]